MDAASSGPAVTDEALMCAYRDGDADAFDALYARYKDRVYRFMLRQSGDEHNAAELHQDVWMRVIRSRDRYRPQSLFRTWLYTIAHNRLNDHYRAAARRAARIAPLDAHELDCPDAAPLPAEALQRQQLRERLGEQIAALPPLQREAFLLQQEAGLSLEQIAEVAGVARETVKSRLRYAFNKLRAGLREAS